MIFGIPFYYLGKPLVIVGARRIKALKGLGIYPGARIEIGREGVLSIGRNVRVGQSLFLQTNSKITINNNVTISAGVFIGSTDYEWGEKTTTRLKDREEIEKDVVIDEGVFIGFGAVILPGAHLKKGCIVGANRVVKGIHEKYSILK